MPVGVLPCDIFSMGAAAAAGGQKSSHTFNGSSSSSRSGQGYYWVGMKVRQNYSEIPMTIIPGLPFIKIYVQINYKYEKIIHICQNIEKIIRRAKKKMVKFLHLFTTKHQTGQQMKMLKKNLMVISSNLRVEQTGQSKAQNTRRSTALS